MKKNRSIFYNLIGVTLFSVFTVNDAYPEEPKTVEASTFQKSKTPSVKRTASAPTTPDKDCGLSCHYQKAYESALFQLEYVQTKSKILADAWKNPNEHDSERVSVEIKGFCRDDDFNDSSKKETCYKNAQLFLASSIARYQDALKEIADSKAKLTTGREVDGSIRSSANKLSLESAPEEELSKLTIPKVSELREEIKRACKNTGTFNFSSKNVKAIWEELLYVGNANKKSENFKGAANKIKEVPSENAQTHSQVYIRKQDGEAEKDLKLLRNNEDLNKLYTKKAQKNVESFKGIEFKANILNQSEDSISYRALMKTRNDLLNAYSGEIKKSESKKSTSSQTSKASSKNLNEKNTKQSMTNSEVIVGDTIPTQSAPYRFGEDAQPELKSLDTNYNVNHTGLNKELNADALKEAEN